MKGFALAAALCVLLPHAPHVERVGKAESRSTGSDPDWTVLRGRVAAPRHETTRLLRAAEVVPPRELSISAAAPPGASSCSGCHAVHSGPGAAVPPITGRPASDIADAMAAYRAGERPATIMTRIAKGFTPEESRAIAEWLEAQR